MMGTSQRTSNVGRGFSLVELLVVIAIIAIVIAIVLPALGAVRDIARKSSTQALVTEVTNASTQFRNDKRRMPGYFTPRQMGDTQNLTRGMSAAENMMIDLAYNEKDIATSAANGLVAVGPRSDSEIYVDPAAFGRSGSYLVVTGTNYQTLAAGTQQISNVAGHAQLRDLVDAWGQPLLVWQEDTQSTFPVTQQNEFARETAGTSVGTRARFYLATNSCFLNATQVGRQNRNQTDAERGSILAVGGQTNREASLGGLLGLPTSLRSEDITKPVADMLPTKARGELVVQSAGTNGYYLGRGERGAKSAPNYTLYFGLNYKDANGNLIQGDSGGNQVRDIRTDFDDIVSSVGN